MKPLTKKRRRTMAWGLALLATAGVLTGSLMPPPASAGDEIRGHQVFFRGGWVGMNSGRDRELFTDVHGAGQNLGLSGNNNGTNGWYLGAGLDQLMHKNLFGIQGMSLVGEVGLEFKRLASSQTINTGNLGGGQTNSPNAPATLGLVVNKTTPSTTQITMLTVDVAPKLKFRDGSKLRPWVIPIGLDFHVISPPSNQTNYLDIGVQFGGGVEYNVWGPFNLGLDARYHLAANMTNTVNNYGTIGTYLGILY
jgi:hypothetical protein